MLQHNHHQRQFVGKVRNWTWSLLNSECAVSTGQITPEAGSAAALPNSSSSCVFKYYELICVFPPEREGHLHLTLLLGSLVIVCDFRKGFPKESTCNAGDTREAGLIPGSGRSPGRGNGNPLQYSCLGNSMDREAQRAIVHGV